MITLYILYIAGFRDITLPRHYTTEILHYRDITRPRYRTTETLHYRDITVPRHYTTKRGTEEAYTVSNLNTHVANMPIYVRMQC